MEFWPIKIKRVPRTGKRVIIPGNLSCSLVITNPIVTNKMPEKDDKFCLAKDKVDKSYFYLYKKLINHHMRVPKNAYGENKSSK